MAQFKSVFYLSPHSSAKHFNSASVDCISISLANSNRIAESILQEVSK